MKTLLFKEMEEISKAKKIEIQDVLAEAVKVGLEKLWQDIVLDKYINKKISKKEAIKFVGVEKIYSAEKQKKAVLADVKWGLYNA